MIGALKPFLRRMRHCFATVDVGQADVHDDEVDLAGLGGVHALGAGIDAGGLELFMQGELLGQPVAQLGIVVDDQNLARIRHSTTATALPCRPATAGLYPAAGRALQSPCSDKTLGTVGGLQRGDRLSNRSKNVVSSTAR